MTSPSQPLSVVIRGDLDELPRLQEALDAFQQAHDLPTKPVAQLQLALEEHVTNIIRHGMTDDSDRSISLLGRIDQGEIVLEVTDAGTPFNPLDRPPVDIRQPLDERPLGGLGVHMMRGLTDRLEYRREGIHNILSFHKRLEV